MIPWLLVLYCVYVAYYTVSYARVLWRDSKPLASSVVTFLALAIVALPLYLMYR